MLPLDTILTVIAYHKITGKETKTEMTYLKWKSLKKNKNYFYKCLQTN